MVALVKWVPVATCLSPEWMPCGAGAPGAQGRGSHHHSAIITSATSTSITSSASIVHCETG